jgi:SAM-dependent methyltransferase
MLEYPIVFGSSYESHQHSLNTLNALFEYDDFMQSIDSLVDLGCGEGLDLEWWATRETRDENPEPLNIDCVGIDVRPDLTVAREYPNIVYERQDFERPYKGNRKFDVAWSHNAFQYALDPFVTLRNVYNMLNPGGMFVLIVPQTTNMVYNQQAFEQLDGVYHNYTLVSLIHLLAVSGFDCHSGFFLKNPEDPWLHAVVYKSEHEPQDPRTTRWFDLMDLKLLPETAEKSINLCGHVRQKDLILPWLTKSMIDYSQQ